MGGREREREGGRERGRREGGQREGGNEGRKKSVKVGVMEEMRGEERSRIGEGREETKGRKEGGWDGRVDGWREGEGGRQAEREEGKGRNGRTNQSRGRPAIYSHRPCRRWSSTVNNKVFLIKTADADILKRRCGDDALIVIASST